MLQLISRQPVHVSFRISLLILLIALLSVGNIDAQKSHVSEEAQRLGDLHGLEPKLVDEMLAVGIPAELVDHATAGAYLSEVESRNKPANAVFAQHLAMQGSTLLCDLQIYHGVQHCTDDNGDTHLILVDLANPHVRIQTVLPINENDEECNSVNSREHPHPDSRDITSNCTHPYPRETVKDMLTRYVDGFRVSWYSADRAAVAIINTDYFGADQWGPQGLAVRIGERLDGEAHNDTDDKGFLGSTQPSLAISKSKAAIIDIPKTEQETIQEAEQRINSLKDTTYYNTVGGAPIIVQNGQVINSGCTSPYPGAKCHQVSQSAAGLTDDGRLVLISARKSAEDTANYLINNYQVQTALKFDGGGSVSMAWMDSTGEVKSFCLDSDPITEELTCRRVAEGLLIFSNPIAIPAAKIYVLRGGHQASDDAVINTLQSAGFDVTSGVETPQWNGSQASLDEFDVVVVLYNRNWAQALSTSGMQALNRYLRNGGGMVTGEWFIWRGSSELTEYLPAQNCQWNRGLSTTYTQNFFDPIISAGMPRNFTFSLGNFDGTESCFIAMPNATVFYSSSNGGGRANSPGLVGWTVQLGRVASFSTLLSATELQNEEYKQLFINTVSWASRARLAELSVRKKASRTQSKPGETNGYTLQFTNMTENTITIKKIWDTLPTGFVYTLGSSNGVTNTDPQITIDPQTGAQTLVWKGLFTIGGRENDTLTFSVDISSNIESGTYFNNADVFAVRNGVPVPTFPASNAAPIRVSLVSAIDIIVGNDDPMHLPPEGNILIIPVRRGRDLTIRAQLSCPSPKLVERADLTHNGASYAMIETPPGSGIYEATIPGSQVRNNSLTIDATCVDPRDPNSKEVISSPLPPPRLFDPSGVITDLKTGTPISGATVTLYRVLGALPDTSSVSRDCRTTETRPPGSTEPWGGVPDHTSALTDEFLDVSFQPAEIDPPINPQTTGSDGRFGWNVVEGCWYIIVEAPGYAKRVSPLVGVPPEVTDLDLRLAPNNSVYLPMIRRN